MPDKYIGKIVVIIYMDQSGKITQRRIEINAIRNGLIRANDLKSGSPRTFLVDNVLAWHPIIKTA
ncbi:hypothetical protein [Paenibacillus macquariensis]|uniref:Uncharacterized protein n=1 Tax=Paenibacillus macquariensis TaxID=948756 RepID=A0ABY1JM29_9BACL|nr:hypothetical protein [Paenibacillus macquariensis]MEC0090617.1 hypothetical protein [Paenibacillus macquariensis]OAB25035.1 hypothetical protein PMSM_28815 [Paenibacillus macquariensis subsp. macquariensis]SIQ45052.1 hypothetical protein SAMN05421578_10246 [Paenibacillus macquariensis]